MAGRCRRGRYEVDLYAVAVQIGERALHYLEVVGTEGQEEAIIGRDLLNHYVVTLDGPAHTVLVAT